MATLAPQSACRAPGRAPTAAVHLVLAASACLVAPLMLASPRSHRAAPYVGQTIRWAAEPVAPATSVAAPVVTHPTQCAGVQSPVRTSRAVSEVTYTTTRRTARTRLGGRFGP